MKRERLNTHDVTEHFNPELSPIEKSELGERGRLSSPLIMMLVECECGV